MSGLAPITYVEILAWQRVHRVELTPWEIDTLRELDAVAIAAAADGVSRTEKGR